ncbi:MAG: MATE family efflux transporter [Bacteroidales bacterium]|nr:MATE family efflux transporter [Bacteroidales bacterium]
MDRKVIKLAIPNIISNITIPLVGLVDVILMGHLESEAYIGAIALGATIFTFIYAGFGFLRMGTSGFTAQAFGARDIKESVLILSRAMLIALIAATSLILLQPFIAWGSFQLIGGSQEVETLAKEYFYIRIWAAPATLGIYALTGWYIGMQNTRIPMVMAIVVNIVNVALSASFIMFFGMKSDGVAWGTVAAQYTGLLVGLIFFRKYFFKILKHWSMKGMLHWVAIKRFVKVNTDILIRSVFLTGSFFYFTAESAVFGDEILAVNALMIQFLWILSYFIDGFAFAAEAIVGKTIGAKNHKDLLLAVKVLLKWGLLVCIPFTAFYFFANESIFHLLTNKQNIIDLSRQYEFWIWIMPLITFSAFIWDGIYIGATASKVMRNTMIVASLGLYIPIYYLFKDSLGNHALWLALMIFMASRGVLLTIYSRKEIFNHKIFNT